MAYKDINSSVRIGGSLTLPAGSITLSNKITLDNATGQITATKFSGDGSLLTNLSSAAMTDVLKLDGTRAMTGSLVLNKTSNHMQFQESGATKWHIESISGNLKLVETGVTTRLQLNAGGAVTITGNLTISGTLTTSGNISAAGYTISATTINATGNLQENGTNLSAKYLALAGGTLTNTLNSKKITASGDVELKESGTATSSLDYWSNVVKFYSSKWNGTAAASTYAYIQGDDNSGFYFASNGSGTTKNVFSITNSGNATTLGTMKAISYLVGATTVIETDAKIDWNKIKNTPATYAPSAHTHLWADITDKPTTFTPSAHTHLWADITDKPATFTPSAHTHLWADITDKPTAFTPASHTHSYTEVNNITTATIIGRKTTGTGAAEALSPTDVRTMINVEDGANKYVHPTGDGNSHVPADGGNSSTKVLKATATAGAPAWGFVSYTELTNIPSTFTPAVHTHTMSDITDLATALSGKLDSTANAVSASKWQTGRKLTLAGDLVGNVTFDGSADFTLTAAVSDDSHDHTSLKKIDKRDVKPADTTVGFLRTYFTSLGGLTGTANSTYQDLLVLNTYTDTSGGKVNALAFDKSTQYIRHYLAAQTDTTWGTPKIIAYTDSSITGNAATATKWQTARTITLDGDVSGTSAAWDGSGNLTITTTVADDSHTHDGRYYTETESDNRFLGITAKAADSDKLDGLDSTDFTRQEQTPDVAIADSVGGWYTIAKNGNPPSTTGGDRASAQFVIRDINSGDHQTVHFIAGVHFGVDADAQMTVLNNSAYGGEGPFKKIRMVIGDTYSGAKVQVFVQSSSATAKAIIYRDVQTAGWTPVNWIKEDTVDTGYTAHEIDIVNRDFVAGRNATDKVEIRRTGIVNATSGYEWNGQSLDNRYEPKGTLHDDRYYTESEMDTKLSGKSDTSHNHDSTYLKLTGGTINGNLTVNGVTMNLGEGLQFTQDNAYFGTNADARIIRIVDSNDTNGNVDGGLIIDTYTSADSIATELLRIRNLEFKWKGNDIWHAGNFTPSDKADKTTTISVGTGLSGGGDLSANRTISLTFGTAAGTVSEGNHRHDNATQSADGFMSLGDKKRIDGMSDGANKTASSATNGNILVDGAQVVVYTHPITDGNLHVPVTSTTNNNKVLKAGATAGSIAWGSVSYTELTNVPTSFTPSSHTHAYTDVNNIPTTTILGRKTTGTGAAEALTKTDVLTLINVEDGANKYVHPTGDGNLHVPANGTTNSSKVLKAGATAGTIAWGSVDWSELVNKPSSFTPSSHTHAYTDVISVPTTTILGRNSANTGAAEALSAATVRSIINVADGANNYVHPSGDGNLHVPATSTTNNNKVLKAGSTAGSLSWGSVAWGEITSVPSTFTPSSHTHAYTDVISVPTASILGRTSASTGATEALTAAQVRTLINVADGANNYTHPTGDGNLHVPATGTTNGGKFLKAGSTAGSISWAGVAWSDISGIPTYDNYGGWTLKVNTDAGANVASGTAVDFKAGSNVTLTRSGNTITIASSYTDTNTWRPIDDTPVDANTTTSISSNWAYDHSALTGVGSHIPSGGTTSQFLRGDGTWATPPVATDTNYYLSGVSGSGNGTVTFTMSGGGTNVTWDASHNHDTAYAAKSHTHTEYLLKAGDTMTGDLTFSSGEKSVIFTAGARLRSNATGSAILSSGGTDKTIYLRADGDTSTTGQVVITNSGMTIGGNTVYHAGNLSTSSFLTTGTSQSTGSGFTVGGTMYVGSTSTGTNNGDLIVRGGGNATIHLDGDSTGSINSTVKSYISGTGNATFAGTVTANAIAVTSTGLVSNLNAERLEGKRTWDFDAPKSNVDIGGYGVYSGMQPRQGGATGPDATIKIDPGVVYTSSGRRFEFTTSYTATVPAAYQQYDRWDIYYVRGPVDGSGNPDPANEGTIQYAKGATDGLEPSVPTGSVLIVKIKVAMNDTGGVTVKDGSTGETPNLYDIRQWRPVRYESSTLKVDGAFTSQGEITEAGSLLKNKYARLGFDNTLTGNQKINGRVHINAAGTLGGTPTSGNYGLRVGTDTDYIAMDSNEILGTQEIFITAATVLYLKGGTTIEAQSKIKASNNATTVTIPAGSTSVTWTHNYGATSYAVNLAANSFERHVRWNSKADNTISIEIDVATTEDILVDCILIGY